MKVKEGHSGRLRNQHEVRRQLFSLRLRAKTRLITMNASSPYDVSPTADVILRSSDNVHFYVIGPLLRHVSPFFMDMFLINQGQAVNENEKMDGLPVIPLEEDSSTLHLLLDLLYPYIKEPPFVDAMSFWKVGKATQKYLIDVIEGKLKDKIVASKLFAEAPLRIYAIAIDLGWDKVATQAARETMSTPLEQLAYVEELRSIPGSGFYRFLEYRLRCDKSSDRTAEELMVLPKTTVKDINVEAPDAVTLSSADTDPLFSSQSTPKSDLILRSSDSVDFYVFEALIRVVSLDFDSSFPLESRVTQDGKTIVHVAENSKTLHQLLMIVYHRADRIDILDYQLYEDVIVAVRKYKMLTIERKLREQLLASPLIQDEPLRVYILGMVFHWEDVVKVAALNTLLKPLQEMNYIEELNRITGGDLFQLMQFRFRCSDAAWNALQGDAKFQQYGPSQWPNYWYLKSSYYDNGTYTNSYRTLSPTEFHTRLKECPRGSTITQIYDAALKHMENTVNHLGYRGNGSDICYILRNWVDAKRLVEEAVSNVSFDMSASAC